MTPQLEQFQQTSPEKNAYESCAAPFRSQAEIFLENGDRASYDSTIDQMVATCGEPPSPFGFDVSGLIGGLDPAALSAFGTFLFGALFIYVIMNEDITLFSS